MDQRLGIPRTPVPGFGQLRPHVRRPRRQRHAGLPPAREAQQPPLVDRDRRAALPRTGTRRRASPTATRANTSWRPNFGYNGSENFIRGLPLRIFPLGGRGLGGLARRFLQAADQGGQQPEIPRLLRRIGQRRPGGPLPLHLDDHDGQQAQRLFRRQIRPAVGPGHHAARQPRTPRGRSAASSTPAWTSTCSTTA